MPYYHVRIKYTQVMTGTRLRFFVEDLSEMEVRTKITEPFGDGVSFPIGEKFFEGDYVNDVVVFKSEMSFQELLLEVRHKYALHADSNSVWALMMEGKLGKMVENVTDMFIRPKPEEKVRIKAIKQISKNVFIVHGREHKPMKELRAMLEEFGLNPIVLHEQPSGSRTIVEKLEKYSDVGYAFVILTPDDIGVSFQELFEKTAQYSNEDEAYKAAKRILEQSKGSVERFVEFNEKFMQDPSDASRFLKFLVARARQNVVLEFGYFIGQLGRDRVCCLHRGDVESPSDMHGIAYIPFKESVKEVEDRIVKELTEAGYQVEKKKMVSASEFGSIDVIEGLPPKFILQRFRESIEKPVKSNWSIRILHPDKPIEKCIVLYDGVQLPCWNKDVPYYETTIFAGGGGNVRIPIELENENGVVMIKDGKRVLRRAKFKNIVIASP